MSGELSDGVAVEVKQQGVGESAKDDSNAPIDPSQPASSSKNRVVSFGVLQIILLVCQTLILIIGAVFIDWWPSNINIYASHREDEEGLGDTHNENQLLQIWQSIYLGVTLLCTLYGAGMQDRGWLMLAMFTNIGLMSLLPFRSGSKEAPFTFFILFFGIASVTLCYILSERIQDRSLMDEKVDEEDVKKKILCFDIPDMSTYHMGVMQVLTSSLMLFAGLLWMMLQEAMITMPARANFSCHSWPGGFCGRYYAFKAQEYYVGRMTISMCVAGGAGLIGAFSKYRFFIDLAMVLTLIPFTGIIENGIYTLGNSEDVRYMCRDTTFWTEARLERMWGTEWDCTTQETYHDVSILFMIIASSVSLFHLWISFRFSEKIQSEDEHKIKANPNCFERLLDLLDSKRLIKLILMLSLLIAIGGIVQIAYGADAASSKQEEKNWDNIMVRVLDNPSYIDAHYIYGVMAIISTIAIWIFFYCKDRSVLSLVFCLLVETHVIGTQSLIWHEIDLLYGVVDFATSDENIYPTYINGEARNTLCGSIQVYYVFNILIMITIFLTILTSEAIQDEKKEEIQKNSVQMGFLDD